MGEEGEKKKGIISCLWGEYMETLLKIWKWLCKRTTSNINILFDYIF